MWVGSSMRIRCCLMECRPNDIGCRLEEIATAVSLPTNADWWGVSISAVAALGTLLIAALNFWLLLKQHRIHVRDRELAARLRRGPFGAALKNEVAQWAVAHVTNRTRTTLEYMESQKLITEAEELAAEASANGLRAFVSTCCDLWVEPPTKRVEAAEYAREINQTITEWTKDPNSVDLDPTSVLVTAMARVTSGSATADD